jgi:hypothetical protein
MTKTLDMALINLISVDFVSFVLCKLGTRFFHCFNKKPKNSKKIKNLKFLYKEHKHVF